MDSSQFDRLAVRLGTRLSRRHALAAAGLSALAVAARIQPLAAQDATPAAPPATPEPAPADESAHPAFLFVQLAESGTWAPKPGEEGVYLLTLRGTGDQTLYFSDRPDRITGTMDTERFLDALGFTPVNPPNAAVVVQTPEGTRDVLVVELFNPVSTRSYGDDGEEWLTYEAKVLNAYQGEGLEEWVPQADDDQLPQAFTNVSLFIDDCPDIEGCYADKREPGSTGSFYRTYVGPVPGGPYGRCFHPGDSICYPCERIDGSINGMNGVYSSMCNAAYPGPTGCWDSCYVDTCRWGGTC